MVNIIDIINWVEGIEIITWIIIGVCLISLFIFKKFVNKWRTEVRQMPDLNVVKTKSILNGKEYITKKFEVGGRTFNNKPDAFNYAKIISKKFT